MRINSSPINIFCFSMFLCQSWVTLASQPLHGRPLVNRTNKINHVAASEYKIHISVTNKTKTSVLFLVSSICLCNYFTMTMKLRLGIGELREKDESFIHGTDLWCCVVGFRPPRPGSLLICIPNEFQDTNKDKEFGLDIHWHTRTSFKRCRGYNFPKGKNALLI